MDKILFPLQCGNIYLLWKVRSELFCSYFKRESRNQAAAGFEPATLGVECGVPSRQGSSPVAQPLSSPPSNSTQEWKYFAPIISTLECKYFTPIVG